MDPPISECMQKLVAEPPENKQAATALFGYFSSRLGEISQQAVVVLGESHIVPVSSSKQEANKYHGKPSASQPQVRHLTPKHCYLGSSSAYNEIFDFVDLGCVTFWICDFRIWDFGFVNFGIFGLRT